MSQSEVPDRLAGRHVRLAHLTANDIAVLATELEDLQMCKGLGLRAGAGTREALFQQLCAQTFRMFAIRTLQSGQVCGWLGAGGLDVSSRTCYVTGFLTSRFRKLGFPLEGFRIFHQLLLDDEGIRRTVIVDRGLLRGTEPRGSHLLGIAHAGTIPGMEISGGNRIDVNYFQVRLTS